MDIYDRIYDCGIIPVIKIEDANNAAPLAKALTDGEIDVLEVTFRTDAACEAIRNMIQACPGAIVGAGTVSDVDTVKRAVSAGAAFIVAPGFNPAVVGYCVNNGIPVIPGISSATDIEAALSFGLKTLKFFPAETSGGLRALKALSAPYGGIRFMPTGGIDMLNLASYLAFDRVIACGGSWIAREDLINNGNFTEITRLAKEAVHISHGFTFAHVSVSPKPEGSAKNIAIKTISVKRAIAYMERNGIELDYDSIISKNGVPTAVRLKDSFGAFRIHLVQ